MGSATVGTLVITAVIVAVLAVFLIAIGLRLQRLSFTLGTIVVGLRAIREQTRPVGGVVAGIVGDVTAIEGALGEVLAEVDEGAASVPEPAALGDDDGEGEYEDEHDQEEEWEEYEPGEEPAVRSGTPPERRPVFEVPARSRRGGSGMAEAVARARERMSVGR